jgi:hypothetical protein
MTDKISQPLNIAESESSMESNLSKTQGFTKALETLGNLSVITDSIRESVYNYISKPKEVKTPAEKVKKRPDGFDYVEASWMDYQSKQHMPLYEHQLLHVSFQHGWINIIISLTDKITGNVELGADSARIMVKRDAEEPTFRDIIDMGNNLKSALSKAIKNAQSRFGVSADVYQKRESEPTVDERKRFETMLVQVKDISPSRAQILRDQWAGLGTDWSDFLDKWQVYVDRNKVK